VRVAVDFDAQSRGGAIEVRNEPVEPDVLTSNMKANAVVAQSVPQALLSLGEGMAKVAAVLECDGRKTRTRGAPPGGRHWLSPFRC
jgi:hypothetical protein